MHKIDTLCEQRWPLTVNKSGHMLHLLCHQGPMGTSCLQQDSDYVCFWPGYHLHHDTVKHGYSGVVRVDWRVDWRSVVFSDERRFYMYARDRRTRLRRSPGELHFPECIRPQHTGLTSGFRVWRPSVTTHGHIWCFCVVKWTVPATLHRLLIPCYWHFFVRKMMCFSAGLTAAATQRVLRGVQLLPRPSRTPELSPIEHVWDTMKRELTLSPEPATILPNCYNGCKMLGTIYRRMTFGTFKSVCMREYTPVLPPEGATMCSCVTVSAPLTLTCMFHLVWICYIIYSYNDKLPVT